LTVVAAWAFQRIGAIAALRPQVVERAQSYERYARVLAVLRSAMGPDAVARLMSEGAMMTEERALKEALASVSW